MSLVTPFILSLVVAVVAVASDASILLDGRDDDNNINNDHPVRAASATVCEFYNATCVSEAVASGRSPDTCHGNQTCPRNEFHNCFVVWSNEEKNNVTDDDVVVGEDRPHRHRSGHSVKMMGCFLKSDDCQSKDDCMETKIEDAGKGNHLFCCCRGDMCNAKFRWVPRLDQSQPLNGNSVPFGNEEGSNVLVVVICASAATLVVVVLLVSWFVYRQRKDARDLLASSHSMEQGGMESLPSEKLLDTKIDLMGLMAEGRFGKVAKGKMDNDFVAVKVFAVQDRLSWIAEKDIYNLPRIAHDNVLKFIGVTTSDVGLSKDYWLVTEFHERGSLCDFLKANTVTWPEMCKIAYSMACGLSHLHEELPPKGSLDMKLAVAHRDFKSKNVLIKSDLTACIGDFGLALIFEPGKPIGDTHGQVGTRRYMAPEVLEGAITFSRDSFLRIDMYACGLVLWELASRCSMNGISPKEYKLPFEEEIPHPSLEQMHELAVNKKIRPSIPESWSNSPCMSELVATIRDCWDQDAEARLSASNVKERIKAMRELQTRLSGGGGGGGLALTTGQQQIDRQLNLVNSVRSAVGQDSSVTATAEEHEMVPLIIGGMISNGGGGVQDA